MTWSLLVGSRIDRGVCVHSSSRPLLSRARTTFPSRKASRCLVVENVPSDFHFKHSPEKSMPALPLSRPSRVEKHWKRKIKKHFLQVPWKVNLSSSIIFFLYIRIINAKVLFNDVFCPSTSRVSFSEGCWAVVPVVTLSEIIPHLKRLYQNFPGGPVVKNLPANAGDTGLIPGWGRSHLLWSSWAHAPRLLSLCPGAWEPQLRSPCAATTEAFA